MGRGRWALGGWATGTYPPHLTRYARRVPTFTPLWNGASRAGSLVAASPKKTAGCREGWRSHLLPPSPYHSHSHSAVPKPSSPNPSILAPSPTQPLSQGSGSNSTTTTRHTTSIAQRTASVSAWDSLPPPPPHPSYQRAHGVLVPAAASQPSPRYPQRPRVRVPHRIPSHPLRSAYPLPSHRPMTTTGSGFDLLAGLKCSKRPAIAPSQENDMATFQAQ